MTAPRRSLINRQVGAIFAEKQIYRIDHYLGKETVQNLIALRFGNMLVRTPVAPRPISHVQITVAEHFGVEGRGAVLRPDRRAARHGAEPPVAARVHPGHGAAGEQSIPTPCATRS